MDTSLFTQNKILLTSFPQEAQELMQLHLKLVLLANKTTNLTRISSFKEGELLHIEDSLVAYPEISDAPAGFYGDLGTGAGFPGIPLSIVSGRVTTLIDSTAKKTKVLNDIITKLGLSQQVTTFTGRIEELSLEQSKYYSVLTARALSSLPSLLELASPLLTVKGQLICYKAQVEESELQNACVLEEKLGMRLVSDRKAVLSDQITKRRILVFEKVSEPHIKLPRRIGLAQKRPLKN